MPAGYYSGGVLDSSDAYNTGYSIGYSTGLASAQPTTATIRSIVYTVSHSHIGNATTGGGCYFNYHYTRHTHSGSSSSGGGCYTVRHTHTHNSSCYSHHTTHVIHDPYGASHGWQYHVYCDNCDWTYKNGPHVDDGYDTPENIEEWGRRANEEANQHSQYNTSFTCTTPAVYYTLGCNNSPLNSGIVYDLSCGKSNGTRTESSVDSIGVGDKITNVSLELQ